MNFSDHENTPSSNEERQPTTSVHLAGNALRNVFDTIHYPTLSGESLYEAAFRPEQYEKDDFVAVIDDVVRIAHDKNLLGADEATFLAMRLKGYTLAELPTEVVDHKVSSQVRLRQLLRDYARDLNHSTTRNQRRYATAIKGLMNKFLGDPRRGMAIEPMSVGEIEEWLETQQGNNALFGSIPPQHALPLLVGGFDAVFRRAPYTPLTRDNE